jgi:hypothetical protein
MPHENRQRSRSVRLRVHIERISITPEKHRMFLDVFHFFEKNITRRQLGELFGVFSINPHAKNAGYITNFLASELRKEYYAKPRRSASDSFEAALQKVNRALGEVAKEGNLSWQGSLDGAICAIENGVIHFALCGKARLLLLRDGKIMELNEIENATETHPLKTFADIASGKILDGDRFFLCDRKCVELFGTEEIEQESRHCDRSAFVQLLRTAMINELDFSGAIIADIIPDNRPSPLRKALVEEKHNSAPKSINVFGREAFLPKPKSTSKHIARNHKKEPPKEEASEFVDENGHYYVRQDFDPSESSTSAHVWIENLRERLYATGDILRSFFARSFRKARKRFRSRNNTPIQTEMPDFPMSKKTKHVPISPPKESSNSTQEPEIDTVHKKYLDTFIQTTSRTGILSFQLISSAIRTLRNVTTSLFRSIVPRISSLTSRFLRLNRSQKIITLLALALILSSPIITNRIAHPTNTPIEEIVTETNQETPQTADDFWREKWEQERSVRFLGSSEITPLFTTKNDTLKTFARNNSLISVSPTTISLTTDNEVPTFSTIPDGKIVSSAAYMDDLGLVFFLTEDDSLLSWSPTTGAFSPETLPLPESATNPEIIGTFLTYLYVLNTNTKDLFRFPRETGGFGEPTSWFRESIPLEDPTQWSVDTFLHIANETTITSFSQGKKVNTSLESSFVPLSITDIFSTDTTLFILDGTNGRIVVANVESGIIEENIVGEALLSSREISGATDETLFVRSESGDILNIPR